MENLKKVYYANWWVLGITLLLYLTIWFGAILHILFGIFQLVTSFYLLFRHKELTQEINYQLALYYALTIITCITPFTFNGDFVHYAWFATWALALYFIGILYQTTIIKL